MKQKQEIFSALEASFEEMSEFLEQQSDTYFVAGPEGKWQAGQHLNHLIISTNPITKAMKLPAFVLRYKFGKPNRPGRSYDQVVKRYQEKLSQIEPGRQAPSRFLPKEVTEADKPGRIQAFRKAKTDLIKQAGKWSESKLDACLLPHPLLGKVTLREVLFFTNYHTQHHLKILKDNY